MPRKYKEENESNVDSTAGDHEEVQSAIIIKLKRQ